MEIRTKNPWIQLASQSDALTHSAAMPSYWMCFGTSSCLSVRPEAPDAERVERDPFRRLDPRLRPGRSVAAGLDFEFCASLELERHASCLLIALPGLSLPSRPRPSRSPASSGGCGGAFPCLNCGMQNIATSLSVHSTKRSRGANLVLFSQNLHEGDVNFGFCLGKLDDVNQ